MTIDNKWYPSRSDKTMEWIRESKDSCSIDSNSLQIKIQRAHGFIGPHIPYHREMTKRICVVPIMHRVGSLSDALQICLWFYNDNKSERDVSVTFLITNFDHHLQKEHFTVFTYKCSHSVFVSNKYI